MSRRVMEIPILRIENPRQGEHLAGSDVIGTHAADDFRPGVESLTGLLASSIPVMLPPKTRLAIPSRTDATPPVNRTSVTSSW